MKLVLKILGGIVLLAGLGAGAAVGYFYGMLPKKRAPQNVHAPNTPEAIARGEYLAKHVAVCVGCHSKVDETQPGEPLVEGQPLFQGRDFGTAAGFPGHVVSPNLTPDKEHGIGNFTDGELLRAIREGIGRDGRVLFPIMPYQTFGKNLSDDDALAIIAYLRTLPPSSNDPGKTHIDFPVSMFIRAAPKPVEHAAGPEPTDPLARGQWLMEMGSCKDCHTPMDKGKPIEGKTMAGGMKFAGDKGTVWSANITQDQATGIGAWSDDDILRVLSEGKDKSGRELYVMPWRHYAGMTDEDKKDLVMAIRTIKPVANTVPAAVMK